METPGYDLGYFGGDLPGPPKASKMMAQSPKMKNIGSTGSISLGIFVQVDRLLVQALTDVAGRPFQICLQCPRLREQLLGRLTAWVQVCES